MTRLARDLAPAPWYGDRLVYDVLAVMLPAIALVGLVLA